MRFCHILHQSCHDSLSLLNGSDDHAAGTDVAKHSRTVAGLQRGRSMQSDREPPPPNKGI
jgi:hypothetical protein